MSCKREGSLVPLICTSAPQCFPCENQPSTPRRDRHRQTVEFAIEKAKTEGAQTIGQIAPIFQDVLTKDTFVCLNLDLTASKQTSNESVAYVMMHTLSSKLPRSIGLSWLSDKEKAKYTYLDGRERGSLVDLVLNVHGTTFPRKEVHVFER